MSYLDDTKNDLWKYIPYKETCAFKNDIWQ